ncbi:MAG TPA: hypothetical protein VFK48_03400 [Usitatibacter sp.]|nr:hypothetical protein [Usitatibacter sp.]
MKRNLRFARARVLAAVLATAGFAGFHGAASAQVPSATLPTTNVRAVATYESVGLYWSAPGSSNGCSVRFRKSGDTAWIQGLDMWFDARDNECRGSLVQLQPNTYYQVEMGPAGGAMTNGVVFKTWSNSLPVAKTIVVNNGSGTLNITEGGSASTGYVVYEGNGATLDAGNAAQFNVSINASYVIVRGLTLRGAQQDAIRISPNVKDVVIEDNDISGWGRTRDGKWGADMDSGIRAVCSQPTLERVTIQRNKIHDPRYSANSWTDGHPAGPQGVTISYCGGNHVIRHNEMYSTNGNYFNDVIGGEDNFTKSGFPNADTDIYGNKLSHGWDDGIEAEGGNENVRIWGNYIDRTAIGIATTVASIGPMYVFRNVYNRSQMYANRALDQDDRQPFFKSGTDSSLGYGRRYFFHNTMLQAVQSGLAYTLGGGFGMGGTGSTQLINNTFSKNNIYHLWKPGKGAFYQFGTGNEFANDMYNGTAGDASVSNGISAAPTYAAGNGWQSEAGGQYQLAAGTAGYGQGVRIPNFNDGASAPDVGAHQSGTPAMKFGIGASPGSAVSGSSNPTGTTTSPTPAPTTPTATSYNLTVVGTGSGTGTVTSSPSAINCGSTCTASFAAGSSVSLTATPASGSTFSGWSGACSGTGSCTVAMSAAQSVTATFTSSQSGSGVTMSATSLGFANGATTQTVTYTNNTGAKVTFIQASISSTKFGQTNNCGDVPAGGSCTATVTYYPTNSGATTGTFTMTSTAPNSPHLVSLSADGTTSTTGTTGSTGSGTQTVAGIAVSATALDFVTGAMTQNVTFTNNTGAKVTFIRASISSGKFGQSNNCGEVAPGASCTAAVTYYPMNGGSYTGTFTMTHSASSTAISIGLTAPKTAGKRRVVAEG